MSEIKTNRTPKVFRVLKDSWLVGLELNPKEVKGVQPGDFIITELFDKEVPGDELWRVEKILQEKDLRGWKASKKNSVLLKVQFCGVVDSTTKRIESTIYVSDLEKGSGKEVGDE